MSADGRCVHCNERMIKACADGKIKLWAKMMLYDDGVWYGKCGACKQMTPVPLELSKGLKANTLFLHENPERV